MGKKCVLNCKNYKMLHRFPDKKRDPKRREEWIRLLNLEVKKRDRFYIYACDNHFSKNMKGKRELRNFALPDQKFYTCKNFADSQCNLGFVDEHGIKIEEFEIIEFDPFNSESKNNIPTTLNISNMDTVKPNNNISEDACSSEIPFDLLCSEIMENSNSEDVRNNSNDKNDITMTPKRESPDLNARISTLEKDLCEEKLKLKKLETDLEKERERYKSLEKVVFELKAKLEVKEKTLNRKSKNKIVEELRPLLVVKSEL